MKNKRLMERKMERKIISGYSQDKTCFIQLWNQAVLDANVYFSFTIYINNTDNENISKYHKKKNLTKYLNLFSLFCYTGRKHI